MRYTLLYNIKEHGRRAATGLALSAMLGLPHSSFAQNVEQMFLCMPDTLMPYVTVDARKAMKDLVKINPGTEVHGKSAFDTDLRYRRLSESHIRMNVDSTVTVEMLMMPADGNDSVCCVVRTLQLPEHDSEITLYDRQWKKVQTLSFKDIDLFCNKPDTMSQKRYSELLSCISYIVVEAVVTSDDELTLIPSALLLFKDEVQGVNAILMQRKVKWDRKSFKKY